MVLFRSVTECNLQFSWMIKFMLHSWFLEKISTLYIASSLILELHSDFNLLNNKVSIHCCGSKVTGYSCARRVNVLGNVYLSSLTKNLEYEEREQRDSGGGGALSQGAGHDGSFFR